MNIILFLFLFASNVYAQDFQVSVAPGDGTIGSSKVQDNSVSTVKIQDGAVTASKIANGSIDDSKVSSISSSKILNFASEVLSAVSVTLNNYVLKSELNSLVPKTKWQKKSATITGTGYISALRFNNLTIGKTYKINSHAYFDGNNGARSGFVARFENGSTQVSGGQYDLGFIHGSPDERSTTASVVTFVATANVLDLLMVSFDGSPSSLVISVTLEELANVEQTTQFN